MPFSIGSSSGVEHPDVSRSAASYLGRAAPLFAVGAAAVALIVHARWYRFVCDDAFITLRYAKNLATLGSPVYNPGEHVEGYTNFLWMTLIAALRRVGVPTVLGARLLGAVSGVAVLGAAHALWNRVEPRRPVGGVFVLAALAACAPLAAWTMGGLETPLFTALVAMGVALGADAAAEPSPRRSVVAGAVLAAATLASVLISATPLAPTLGVRRRTLRPVIEEWATQLCEA